MAEIIERDLFKKIEFYLNDNEIIVIHGARQVGKTSLLQYVMDYIAKSISGNTLFIDLEDPVYLEICNNGVEELIKYIRSKGYNMEQMLYIAIDEIQYLDNPSSFLKLLYDRYKEKIKLIVTGSSTFSIKSKFKDSLVGRIIDFELFPLNFREFLRFKKLQYNLDITDIPDSINGELAEHYKEYVIKGGYPAIVLEEIQAKQEKKLYQIITTYIKTDIRDIGKIRNIQKFNHLVQILASQTGSLLNYKELSTTVGIVKQTLEEYLFILENTYVIRIITPYFNNVRSELTKMPKIFFEDSGVADLIENKQFLSQVTGKLFENSVFSEIRKQSGTDYLFFWRTSKGHEIDFILNKGSVVPVEAKLSFRKSDLTPLKYFREKYQIDKVYICTLEKKTKAPPEWIELIYPWELVKIIR